MDWMDVRPDEVGKAGARPDQRLKNLKQGFWHRLSFGKIQTRPMRALPVHVERLEATSVE